MSETNDYERCYNPFEFKTSQTQVKWKLRFKIKRYFQLACFTLKHFDDLCFFILMIQDV